MTSQCVKVGTSVTLFCPVEEKLIDPINWIPNKIHDYNDYDYGDYSATLIVTFPSSILNYERGGVWCDYQEHYYYAIILISGMLNL